MHPKTDVFCSASLILPDKAGRQINVGGWSLDSTYGIRFYTPDGSPGNPSTNDWEENFHEIALQVSHRLVMLNTSYICHRSAAGILVRRYCPMALLWSLAAKKEATILLSLHWKPFLGRPVEPPQCSLIGSNARIPTIFIPSS